MYFDFTLTDLVWNSLSGDEVEKFDLPCLTSEVVGLYRSHIVSHMEISTVENSPAPLQGPDRARARHPRRVEFGVEV